MEKIKIKCPFCGKILIVNDDPANAGKKLRCPACKEASAFEDFKRVVEQKVSDETEVNLGTKTVSASFSLTDKLTGKSYKLRQGRNLVGRMTYKSAPKADVPICTEDMGFSREHLNIEVVRGCDGIFHCYASNASNKNDTFINGELLSGEDKIGLENDDQIKSSSTTLIFHRSDSSFDDGTQL